MINVIIITVHWRWFHLNWEKLVCLKQNDRFYYSLKQNKKTLFIIVHDNRLYITMLPYLPTHNNCHNANYLLRYNLRILNWCVRDLFIAFFRIDFNEMMTQFHRLVLNSGENRQTPQWWPHWYVQCCIRSSAKFNGFYMNSNFIGLAAPNKQYCG